MIRKYRMLLIPVSVFLQPVVFALELYVFYSVLASAKRTLMETNWKMSVSKANKFTIAAAVVFALCGVVILLTCFVFLMELFGVVD